MQVLSRVQKAVGRTGLKTRLYFLGDTHIGNMACHEHLLERMVKRIQGDEDGRVFLMGDILDAVCVNDKRFRSTVLAKWIKDGNRDDIINQQVEYASDILLPIADKIDGIVIGNHEETIIDKASVDPLRMVVNNILGAKGKVVYNASYCSYVRLAWKKDKHHWHCNVVIHHGAGGGAMIGAKANRIERRAGYFPSADIVASGHVHSRLHDPNHTTLDAQLRTGDDGVLELKEHVTHCFLTGSTLRGYDHNATGSLYTERADLAPTALGGMYAEVELVRHNYGEAISINGGCYP